MYIPLFWIVTSWVVVTKADLVCLGWDLISPTVGLLCHFQSETSHSGEKATVAAVGAAVESAKDVVKFDLTHNPATVTYNFFSATSQGGIRQGGQVIADAAKDYEGVTIGFAKESANQLVQLYDLTHWNDVSNCLITGAARLASQALVTARKRAGVPSTDKALVMAHSCISDKFKQISKPALFNITGS